MGRGWVAGRPRVGHKAGRVIGHFPREKRKNKTEKRKEKRKKPGPETSPSQPPVRAGITYSVRDPPLSDIYIYMRERGIPNGV